MLDLKYVVENIDNVIKRLNTRNDDYSFLYELVELDKKRKTLIIDVEILKAKRNEVSKNVGLYKRENKDTTKLLEDVASFADKIKELDEELKEIEEKISNILAFTPNLPDESCPIGKTEEQNVEVKKMGTPRVFAFTPKDHVEISENLDILDFKRAAKITGARFVVDKGLGARLERSLISFMIDTHVNDGYKEIIPPYIVSRESMFASGQFPKFVDEAFKVGKNDQEWYLNPTAEVPTINLYRDEIIEIERLPINYVSFSTAFRAEAGSAGKDTRGILRQHQFNKVELIKFTKPENSEAELEMMLNQAEKILQLLEIPYRVVCLSTGDLGFGNAKTYDIEVWLPGQNTYREISSVSNATDYQGRRANIRFKREKNAKTEYVHTLNGSGLAIGRTMIAILENYQNEDGSVDVPKVLIPYMKVEKITK